MLDYQEIKDVNDSSEKNYEKQDSFSQNLKEIDNEEIEENEENEQKKQKLSESNIEEIKINEENKCKQDNLQNGEQSQDQHQRNALEKISDLRQQFKKSFSQNNMKNEISQINDKKKVFQLKIRDLELIRKMKKLVSQIDEHMIEIEEINEGQKNRQKQMKKHVLSSQIMARFAGERRHNMNLKQDLAGIKISKDFMEIFRGKSKNMSPEEEEQTLQQFLIQHNFQSPKWKKYLELSSLKKQSTQSTADSSNLQQSNLQKLINNNSQFKYKKSQISPKKINFDDKIFSSSPQKSQSQLLKSNNNVQKSKKVSYNIQVQELGQEKQSQFQEENYNQIQIKHFASYSEGSNQKVKFCSPHQQEGSQVLRSYNTEKISTMHSLKTQQKNFQAEDVQFLKQIFLSQSLGMNLETIKMASQYSEGQQKQQEDQKLELENNQEEKVEDFEENFQISLLSSQKLYFVGNDGVEV